MNDTQTLKLARGKRYFDLLKAILYGPTGQAIIDDFNGMKEETAHFTLADLSRLTIKYDLPFKAVCEWLEESHCLPTGTYDRLKLRGLKVNRILDKVRAMEPIEQPTTTGGENENND